MKQIFDDVQASYAAARQTQVRQLAKKYSIPSYHMGDQVKLRSSAFQDHYTRNRPSTKLNAKKIDPFTITELIGKNAIRLDILDTMSIHPVVNVSHTTPYAAQPNDISYARPDPPPPILGPQGLEYEVERILQHRPKGAGISSSCNGRAIPLTMLLGSLLKIFVTRTAQSMKAFSTTYSRIL